MIRSDGDGDGSHHISSGGATPTTIYTITKPYAASSLSECISSSKFQMQNKPLPIASQLVLTRYIFVYTPFTTIALQMPMWQRVGRPRHHWIDAIHLSHRHNRHGLQFGLVPPVAWWIPLNPWHEWPCHSPR